jgi:iron complex outermembrane recepter protein
LGDGYFNDITRGYKQKAAYASVDLELIPESLTLTAGTRYFNINSTEVGAYVASFGCQLIYNPDAPNPCVNRYFTNLNSFKLDRTDSGFRSRVNLSWKVSEDALLYYTWSQGFRSGGFNRAGYGPTPDSPLSPGPQLWQAQATRHGGWTPSLAFAPDNLTNNEVGWKASWWDRRLYWSGAVYREDWNHAQVFAANVLGHVLVNGGTYRVRGVETSVVSRAATGLTIEVGAAWNRGELVKEASFSWADGTSIDFGSLQTASGQKFPNPAGTLGSPLAGAPSFQGSLRARYEFALQRYNVFAQIGAVHQSHSLASTDRLTLDLQSNSTAYNLPRFTTYDAALGIGKNAWLMQIYGENLTDRRAQLYANYSLFNKAVTVNRPRTIGLRVSYKFSSTGEPDS